MPLSTEGTTGGDLCFYELGLALGLKSLDAVFFTSSALTHFNLHFKGIRGSLVFHTDTAAASWVENFNGWNKNKYLSVRQFQQGEDVHSDDDLEDK